MVRQPTLRFATKPAKSERVSVNSFFTSTSFPIATMDPLELAFCLSIYFGASTFWSQGLKPWGFCCVVFVFKCKIWSLNWRCTKGVAVVSRILWFTGVVDWLMTTKSAGCSLIIQKIHIMCTNINYSQGMSASLFENQINCLYKYNPVIFM